MHKIFIDGQEGTTGLKIYERLSARKDIKILNIDGAKRKDLTERKRLIAASDITFLCLPDDAARESVRLAENTAARIIDASTAHRTANGWEYGLPELTGAKEKIAAAKYVAVPGCHANGTVSLIRPLLEGNVIDADYPLAVTSITGYSGGGKKMIAEYEDSQRGTDFDSPRHYALSQTHKHLAEIQRYAYLNAPPVFLPIVSDFYSGMCVSIPLFTKLLSTKCKPNDIFDIYTKYYAGHSIVKVENSGGNFIAANSLSGKDSIKILVSGNADRMTVTAVYDNLGRGASGAAVHCMNLMLGLDEYNSLIF